MPPLTRALLNVFIDSLDATDVLVPERVNCGISIESFRFREKIDGLFGGTVAVVVVVVVVVVLALEDLRRWNTLSDFQRDASLEKVRVSLSLSFLNIASGSHSKA